MIAYVYKTTGSGLIREGSAERIRVCYTPKAIRIKLLTGSDETILELSRNWNADTVSEFRCDKFSLKA